MTTTYTLTIGQCRDVGLTGERVLEIVEAADPTEPVDIRDAAGRVCHIAADLDMDCLTLRRGSEILSIGSEVSVETLDRWSE